MNGTVVDTEILPLVVIVILPLPSVVALGYLQAKSVVPLIFVSSLEAGVKLLV